MNKTRVARLVAALGTFGGAVALILQFGVTQPDVDAETGMGAVMGYLAARGYTHWELRSGYSKQMFPSPEQVRAGAPGAVRRAGKLPNTIHDMILSRKSLAKTNACALQATPCTDVETDKNCKNASTPKQFLCRCSGSGPIRQPDGTKTLSGLFRTFSFIDATICDTFADGGVNPSPPLNHQGCLVKLEIHTDQLNLLSRIRKDTTGDFSEDFKTLATNIVRDDKRWKRRQDSLDCIRPNIPVRMGHPDLVSDYEDASLDGGNPLDSGL